MPTRKFRPIPDLTPAQVDRFLKHILFGEPNECWPWLDHKNDKGYGEVTIGKMTNLLAHRVSYKLSKGEPGDLLVTHSCDNPPCNNPSHLFTGTNQQNMDEKTQRGRALRKYTEEQVAEIKRLYAEGMRPRDIFKIFPTVKYTAIIDITLRRRRTHL